MSDLSNMPALLRSRTGRALALIAATLAVMLALEGLARLIEPDRRYHHERMVAALPAAESARLDRFIRDHAEGFEGHWDIPFARVADTENFVLDERLLWRLRPGLELQAMNYTLPSEVREADHWNYNANAEGWRGPLSSERHKGARAILTLGDSTTYGWGLEPEEAWPARLVRTDRQVFNRAVPGYTTFQGERLLAELLESLRPDVVTLGYGANDATLRPWSDAELATLMASPAFRTRHWLERFALVRVIDRLVVRLAPATGNLVPRVPHEEFEHKLEWMLISILNYKAFPILLSLCQQPPYAQATERIARRADAPLLRFLPGKKHPEWVVNGDDCATSSVAGEFFFADECHPTPAGAALIAEALDCRIAQLEKRGELNQGREAMPLEHEFTLNHTFRRPDEHTGGKPPLLIALHGIGSNEQDLVALQPHLDPRFFVVSAQAPYEYMFPGGYSWFGLQILPGNQVKIDVEQLRQSRDKLVAFVDEVTEAYGTDPKRVYLLGFSQGSMMSYGVLATAPEKLAGIVAMSGRYLPDLIGDVDEEKVRDFPILVTHGTHDDVLPVEHGRLTRDALLALPVKLQYKEYPMGHEVSLESIRDVRNWLTDRLNEGR